MAEVIDQEFEDSVEDPDECFYSWQIRDDAPVDYLPPDSTIEVIIDSGTVCTYSLESCTYIRQGVPYWCTDIIKWRLVD